MFSSPAGPQPASSPKVGALPHPAPWPEPPVTAAPAPGGGTPPRPASLEGTGRGRDLAPLRRLQRLLPHGPRPVDDLLVRGVGRPIGRARTGAGGEVRADLPEARAPARDAAPRRRVWVGRHGAARGQTPRCIRRRRDPLDPAGRMGG